MNLTEYWLYVEPYCFIMMDSKNAIVYNSLSSSKIELRRSGKLGKIIEELQIPKNMYSVCINGTDLKDKQVAEFVNNLKTSFSGDIVETLYCKKRPIIMFPELKIQRLIKNLEKIEDLSVGIDILTYLKEIFIYINGNCNINCSCCDNAFKQTFYCRKQKGELNYDNIHDLLAHLDGTAVNNINITGGNIFLYSEIYKLISFLKALPNRINYHLHYKNAFQHLDDLQKLKNENSTIIIKVDFPVEYEKIDRIVKTLMIETIKHTWNFIIASEREYNDYETLISTFNLKSNEIIPFFNNSNLEFFERNVFLTKEDINSIELNRREIFAKRILNINDFGKLTIMSDGNVYSNINHPPLGNIHQSIYELIFKELKEENSWFNIRQKSPCSECVYQYFCPSPSNYEMVIGKPNLCNIKA